MSLLSLLRLRETRADRRLRNLAADLAVDSRRYYGGGLNSPTHVEVVVDAGRVAEVWFRAVQLPFRVSGPGGHHLYDGDSRDLPRLAAVELID